MEDILTRLALNIDKSSWEPVKFGDVAFEPKETCNDILKEGIEHVVGLEHITTGDIRLRNSATIEESTTFSKKFQPGDVLFGRRRAYLKKAAQASFGGICSGDITVFRAKKNLLPALLPFIVNNDKFFDYAIKHSAGGLSPRVKFKDLANFEFLLPPKEEHAQLAELLWAMDEVIENLQSLLGKINNTKRSFFVESRKVLKFKSLSYYANVSYGLGQPPLKDENGIGVIRATDISRGKISVGDLLRVSENAIPRGKDVRLLDGDIIIVRSGAYTGDLAMITKDHAGMIVGYDLRIRPNLNLIDPLWLTEYLLEKESQSYFKGESIRSAQPHLNSQQVLNTMIPVLDIEKQKGQSKTLKSFYNSLELNLLKIESCKTLQKSLINQIF